MSTRRWSRSPPVEGGRFADPHPAHRPQAGVHSRGLVASDTLAAAELLPEYDGAGTSALGCPGGVLGPWGCLGN